MHFKFEQDSNFDAIVSFGKQDIISLSLACCNYKAFALIVIVSVNNKQYDQH